MDITEILREQAGEVSAASASFHDVAIWGNTMIRAAEEITRLRATIANARLDREHLPGRRGRRGVSA